MHSCDIQEVGFVGAKNLKGTSEVGVVHSCDETVNVVELNMLAGGGMGMVTQGEKSMEVIEKSFRGY